MDLWCSEVRHVIRGSVQVDEYSIGPGHFLRPGSLKSEPEFDRVVVLRGEVSVEAACE